MNNKIKGLARKETLAISEFKELLLEKFPHRLKKIILFGSKARGVSSRSSDIDLLVVVTKDGKRVCKEMAILIHHPIAKYMVDISPLMVEEGFFKQWSPLLEHIKKDGIVIWTDKKGEKSI